MAPEANLVNLFPTKFLAATTAFSAARAMGANDRVNIVVVGVGGRGNDHIGEYAKLPECRSSASAM